MDILKINDGFLKTVDGEITGIISRTEAHEARELLGYALSQKGRMLRPSLVYTAAFAINPCLTGRRMKKLVRYAAAIELLHTASLVHDDILDFAEERRGIKSVYKAFGAGCALLTGNVFYLNAFDLANRHLGKPQIESMLQAATDMCCGELIQLSNQGRTVSTEVYIDIIRKKTASLIKHACKEGARIAGAAAESIAGMQSLGEYLGILYQLADDNKDGDVLLEEAFDFRRHIRFYTGEAGKIISGLEESIYKRTFEEFTRYFEQFV